MLVSLNCPILPYLFFHKITKENKDTTHLNLRGVINQECESLHKTLRNKVTKGINVIVRFQYSESADMKTQPSTDN